MPGREGLYRSLGFRRKRTAMVIFEDQVDAFARLLVRQVALDNTMRAARTSGLSDASGSGQGRSS